MNGARITLKSMMAAAGVLLLTFATPFVGAARAQVSGVPSLGVGASLNGKRVFPADNPWNTDISGLPVDPNSAVYLNAIGFDKPLHPDFGTVLDGAPIGIPYIVISGAQARHTYPVTFDYYTQSDPGPYPTPPTSPIEGGPLSNGDRHVICIDRDNWKLYEMFNAFPIGTGASASWTAGSGAIFDLKSNALRPEGWTSADAAGLPIFPGLVRYDEVFQLGAINHALRFTCHLTAKRYVYPARHWASYSDDPTLPPMGMRMRLKASVDISGYPAPVQVILTALKKYGMFLADNGGDMFISGTNDMRWNDDMLHAMTGIKSQDFEVVQMP